jgi:S1-C subfamily serine protease
MPKDTVLFARLFASVFLTMLVILAPRVESSHATCASADSASRCPARAIGQTENGVEAVCGWIGVQVSPMTRPFAESLGMTELYGAIFDRPEANSPAAHQHIEAGDVLTKINGEPLRDARDFQPIISAMAPGTIVYLTTYRDRQLIERKVALGYAHWNKRS